MAGGNRPIAAWVAAALAGIILAGAGPSPVAGSASEAASSGVASSGAASSKASTSKKDVILATTTSTQDSGLLDALLPVFEKGTGYRVKTVAVGSGQALALGRRGEADVLLVHSPEAEEAFMAEGAGSSRRLVMHNDFVVVGPMADPAGIRGAVTGIEALRRIAARGAAFLSRADNSGTHALEQKLWKTAAIDPQGKRWYQETGLGMGQTLAVAAEKRAYTISDRGTWLAVGDTTALSILVEGDPPLWNFYHVIEVNGAKWPKVNVAGARAFADFLVSKQGQDLIAGFGAKESGRSLFTPDAGRDEKTGGAPSPGAAPADPPGK